MLWLGTLLVYPLAKNYKLHTKLGGAICALLSFLVTSILFFHYSIDLGAVIRQQLSYQLEKKSGWKLHDVNIRSSMIPGSFLISDLLVSKKSKDEDIYLSANEVKLNRLSLLSLAKDKEIEFASVSMDNLQLEGKAIVKGTSSGKISLPVKTDKVEISNGKANIQVQLKNGTILEIGGEADFTMDNLNLKNAEIKDLPKILKDGKGKNLTVRFDNSAIAIAEVHAKNGKVAGKGISLNVRPADGNSGTSVSGNITGATAEFKKGNTGNFAIEGADLDVALYKSGNSSPDTTKLNSMDGSVYITNSKLSVHDHQATGTVNHTLQLEAAQIDKEAENISLIEARINNYEGKKKSQILKIASIDAQASESLVQIIDLSFSQDKTGDMTGVQLEIPAISGAGVHVESLLHKELFADKVTLTDPVFSFHTEQTEGEAKSINNLLNQFFISQGAKGKIAHTTIQNGNLSLMTTGKSDTLWHKAQNFTLKSKNLALEDKTPIGSTGFDLKIPAVMVASRDGNFHIEGQDLHIVGDNKSISGKQIKVRQQHSRGAEQPFFFTATADSFVSQSSFLQNLLDRNEINLDKLNVLLPEVRVELDENKLPKSCSATPLLPKHVLELIPFPVNIENMNFEQGLIDFTDIVPDFPKPGIFKVSNTSISATNVSNFRNEESQIKLKGLMEGAELDMDLRMNLLSPELTLNYKGTYGKAEMARFNDWLYFDGFGAEKGTIHGITFDINTVNGKAEGSVQMQYEDLKMIVYNQKKQKKSKIKSFFSRFLVHKNNMNKKGRSAETVAINTSWKPEYSFMYYLWHPVKEGMVHTITKDFYMPKME